MQSTRKERTGWRDEALSRRHRLWGFDCPAVDIDFLMVEFDHGTVCALVEYKNEFAAPQYASHPSYKALIDLANRAGISLFACRYSSDFETWHGIPLNRAAKCHLPQRIQMSEREWVGLLYRLRGRAMPSELFGGNNHFT